MDELTKKDLTIEALRIENTMLKTKLAFMERELPLSDDSRKAYFKKVTGALTEHYWNDIHKKNRFIHNAKNKEDLTCSGF